MRLLERSPTLAWAASGFFCVALLVASGGSVGWRDGGLVTGAGGTVASWLIGGAATAAAARAWSGISRRRAALIAAGWVVAGLAGLLAGWRLAAWLEGVRAGGIVGFGLEGLVLGVGVGGGVGGALTAGLGWPAGRRASGAVALGSISFLGFAAGGLVSILGMVVLGQLAKVALAPVLGRSAGLVLGSGLGGALGGAAAGKVLLLGFPARRVRSG